MTRRFALIGLPGAALLLAAAGIAYFVSSRNPPETASHGSVAESPLPANLDVETCSSCDARHQRLRRRDGDHE